LRRRQCQICKCLPEHTTTEALTALVLRRGVADAAGGPWGVSLQDISTVNVLAKRREIMFVHDATAELEAFLRKTVPLRRWLVS
jgi:tryptophanase